MGLFATFCGFMYNDFASVPLFINTCYEYLPGQAQPIAKPGCVHKIGVDPAWYLSPNEITYLNSMKMKISVIFGVAHMALGVLMKGANSIFYKSPVDFCLEFIPQLVMMLALFGYMDLLIILKWLTDYSGKENEAPSIITTMIAVFLEGGKVPEGTRPLLGSAQT
jgi:V-type H+-transporting ATPase subunit a